MRVSKTFDIECNLSALNIWKANKCTVKARLLVVKSTYNIPNDQRLKCKPL